MAFVNLDVGVWMWELFPCLELVMGDSEHWKYEETRYCASPWEIAASVCVISYFDISLSPMIRRGEDSLHPLFHIISSAILWNSLK
jgi:hypothetical protein